MSEAPWRHVHPASFAVNLVPRAWGLLRAAWPLFLALLVGGRNRDALVNLAIVLVFFGLALASSVVHMLTLRYRVADGRLEIRSGLLSRQVRAIALDRVQNVVVVRNVYHRLSGLCEVRVETASGREVEGLLSAVSFDEAERLTAELSAKRSPTEAAPDEVLVSNTPLDLVWSGLADLRVASVAVVLGALSELFPQLGPEAQALAAELRGAAGAAVVVALITGTWIVGVAGAVVRRWGFTLARTDRGLVAEQGLLTRRRTELRTGKVQLGAFFEPVVLRLGGLGSVMIETAAARETGSGTERAEAVVPTVDAAEATAVLQVALGLPTDPLALPLRPAHPFARWRAALGALLRVAGVGGLATAVFGALAAAAALAALPIVLWTSQLDVRAQGAALFDRVLVSRRGWLTRRTDVLDRSKVQSASVVQGPLERWFGVALVVVRVAGSRVVLPLLPELDAVALVDRLMRPGAPVEVGPAA